ncbi:hypothetical protein EHV15_34940 [Paenibacillus oralis]|uniref:Uncharacterized protein n=1 Tax=Paenibacillus oralis TaxID=2490856 RepID=A0A3P3T9W5_9BACL|nr:hypothetical protein [Paenibacillus oralis]RRJ54790.1 hypothetical protein EHV15_34940 [Paenibacillus oralis]
MNGYYEKFKVMDSEDKKEFILFFRERYGVSALSDYFSVSKGAIYQWYNTLGIPKPKKRTYFRDTTMPDIGDPDSFMKEFRSKSLDEVKVALKLLDTPKRNTGSQTTSENQSQNDNSDPVLQNGGPSTKQDSSVDTHPEDVHTNNLSVSLAGSMSYSELSKKLETLFSLLSSSKDRKYFVELRIRESE